jgi:hypothetical protein
MRRLGMALGAIGLFSSGLLDAQATPLSSSSTLVAQNSSALVQVGCERSGDNCPYGYRIERHGGHGWSCEPCWSQKHSYWGDRDYEPRHYREHGDEGYEPRRYRNYGDDQGYDPRWYRNY